MSAPKPLKIPLLLLLTSVLLLGCGHTRHRHGLARFRTGEPVGNVTFSPDERWLLTSNEVDRVRLFDLRDGIERFSFKGVRAEFAGSGRRIVVASRNGFVSARDIWSGKRTGIVSAFRHDMDFKTLFNPDRRKGSLIGFDGGHPARMRGPFDLARAVEALSVSPDGKSIALGYSGNGGEGFARIVSIDKRDELLRLGRFQSPVDRLVFNADNSVLITRDLPDRIYVWNARHGVRLDSLRGNDFGLSTDGRTLAVCAKGRKRKREIQIVNLANGQMVRSLEHGKETAWTPRFSPDGNHLLAVLCKQMKYGDPCEYRAAVWDVRTGKRRKRRDLWKAYYETAWSISPDANTIASGSDTGTVQLWNVTNSADPLQLHGLIGDVRCLAFSPSGRALAAGDADGMIYIWDLTQLSELAPDR